MPQCHKSQPESLVQYHCNWKQHKQLMAHSSRDSRNSHNNYQRPKTSLLLLSQTLTLSSSLSSSSNSSSSPSQANLISRVLVGSIKPAFWDDPHHSPPALTVIKNVAQLPPVGGIDVGIRLTWNYLSVGARWRNSISPGSPLPPPTPILDLSPSPQAWTDLKWWAQYSPSQM